MIIKSAHLQAIEALKASSPETWKSRGSGHLNASAKAGEQASISTQPPPQAIEENF